ncbi:hypothetical protein [Mycobacterium vicinigordonae]|uniref:Uncharacterized protein n=1 Tax=Mycobacterium vicinigordonae TaxID=1719132 RepID=A0A7D6DXE2_9MYCO|nr:hypothetical protein [Mycobacterium vicinigordonae]QLL06868.1 hypothetical protein H0P51_24740 [Mycobacterium vicinigordonae]
MSAAEQSQQGRTRMLARGVLLLAAPDVLNAAGNVFEQRAISAERTITGALVLVGLYLTYAATFESSPVIGTGSTSGPAVCHG